MSLSLTALPAALPVGLQGLSVSNNQLSSLPAALPVGLRWLDASNNRLTNLPGTLPETLQDLNVGGNRRLSSLPDALPAGLRRLNASNCRLSSLPAALPIGLRWLDASNNRLTNLPGTLPETLQYLNVGGNLLNRVPDALPSQGQTRALRDALEKWLDREPEVVAAWQRFASEPGAREYALFLDRLRDTVSYRDNAFRETVAEDLRHAVTRPQLLEQYFQLALGATASCEDRVTLTWNGMQTVRLNADVEDGAYDERLDKLLQQGRVAFRLDTLEEIARENIRSLRRADPNANIDEIEVYLAYQTQLREPLELWHIAPEMLFFGVSCVTKGDLVAAETSVRNREAAEFGNYLATRWQPWETVVGRIAPEPYAAMKERLADAMGEEFESRLKQRLADQELTGDPDAERVFGAQILNELVRKIKSETMHQVLGDRGLQL
ncbi:MULTISPECIES: NEL-type E3 ubiquitin ligase domain-containing protein [Bradyrhizobium]|uniref:NEL-type E3 ubiquitin ligase domain-containing protein n=1 Tax=Bradyrhizobium TaxID=374 RepID=UPI00289BBCAB|nr:NEL-type E3 ubiquitin ligase domain-containing protein [Bradyrhizobium altum]